MRAGAKRDADRERRIIEEILVDAYGAEERAISWYYYLEDQLGFPFTATCIANWLKIEIRRHSMWEWVKQINHVRVSLIYDPDFLTVCQLSLGKKRHESVFLR